MVRVPTSKACNTCRARKKGCDRKTPSCGQCLAAGLDCAGYARAALFVHSQVTNGRNKAIYAKQPAGAQNLDSSLVVLHPSLEAKAVEDKYLGLYWAALLPGAAPIPGAALEFSTGGWTGAASQMCRTNGALRLAALALGMTMVGSRDDDGALVLRGLQTYTRAVQAMGHALRGGMVDTDGLLAAARFMHYYETFFACEGEQYRQMDSLSRNKAWFGHMNGEVAMFLMKGPECFTTGRSHQLFVDGRCHTLYDAITRRRASPFNAPVWKTIPWRTTPKTRKDQAVDCVAHIPGLLQDLDALRADYSEGGRRQLLEQCLRVEAEMAEWEDAMGAGLLQRYDHDHDHAGAPLPQPRDAVDFGVLHLCQLYWCACLLLYSTMWFAQALAPMDSDDEPPAPYSHPASTSSLFSGLTPLVGVASLARRQMRQTAPTAYAFKLARSFHLAYLPGAGALGSFSSSFPLVATLSYLTVAGDMGLRCVERDMICGIFGASYMGRHVGRFFGDMWLDNQHAYWWLHGFGGGRRGSG